MYSGERVHNVDEQYNYHNVSVIQNLFNFFIISAFLILDTDQSENAPVEGYEVLDYIE